MNRRSIQLLGIGLAGVFVMGTMALAEDKLTLKAANGVALAEFKGYETWQLIAPSVTDDGLKGILGNSVAVKAYESGIPGNGKPFPDGTKLAKIEWSKAAIPASPYTVSAPGALKSLSFMEKDAKRFSATDGWGYAQFTYDPKSKSLAAFGSDGSFANVCHTCHTRVAASNFVFTHYGWR